MPGLIQMSAIVKVVNLWMISLLLNLQYHYYNIGYVDFGVLSYTLGVENNFIWFLLQNGGCKCWIVSPCWAGMSDLCSPMIILLEDEADAFWCFERLMRRLVKFWTESLDLYIYSGIISNQYHSIWWLPNMLTVNFNMWSALYLVRHMCVWVDPTCLSSMLVGENGSVRLLFLKLPEEMCNF